MRKISKALYLVGVAAISFQSLPALAQETADAEATAGGGVGDIVVTARKRQESSNSVGMSISAIGGDALVQQGVTSAADLVKLVPGFNFTRGSYGGNVFTIRGIGFNESTLAAAPTVSTYVDEVPLAYSIMTKGTAFDLERVEVLKGPQGTLFGQNSTGGAINYIARKPTDSLEAGVSVTVGRFSQVDAEAYVSGPISDTLRARVALRKEYAGPWQISNTRPSDRLGRNDKFMGRAIVDWDASERLRFSFNLNGWQDRSDSQAGQLIGIYSGARAPAILRTQPISPETPRAADWGDKHYAAHDDFIQGSVRADWEATDDVTITSLSSYSHLKRNSFIDADGTAIENFEVLNRGNVRSFSQELRASGTAGNVEWVVGGNYQRDKVDELIRPFATESSFPFDVADTSTQNRVTTLAAFANVDWEVAPGVTLGGGIRYTDQKRDFEGCTIDSGAGDLSAAAAAAATALSGRTITIAPGSCVTLSSDFVSQPYIASLNEDNLSWRGSVNWQVDTNKLLYASVSKGYKNGVFPTTGATFAASFLPAKQESVLAYEAGFKLGLLNRRMQLNGAAFYYDYRDKQIRGRVIDPVLGFLNRLLNIPKSRIAGAEIQLIWEPVDGLTFNGGATYVDSKVRGSFINYSPLGTLSDFGGQAFPLTPKWQLSGDLQYDFPINSNVNLFFGANATYQSKTNSALGQEAWLCCKNREA